MPRPLERYEYGQAFWIWSRDLAGPQKPDDYYTAVRTDHELTVDTADGQVLTFLSSLGADGWVVWEPFVSLDHNSRPSSVINTLISRYHVDPRNLGVQRASLRRRVEIASAQS